MRRLTSGQLLRRLLDKDRLPLGAIALTMLTEKFGRVLFFDGDLVVMGFPPKVFRLAVERRDAIQLGIERVCCHAVTFRLIPSHELTPSPGDMVLGGKSR